MMTRVWRVWLITLLTVLVTRAAAQEAEEGREWCGAAAEEALPAWDYCADGGNPVTVEVKAVSGPNLDPSSDVFLKLVGTEGTTQDIRIASEEGGTKRRVQTSAADVGPLEAVIVRSDSKDKAAHWRCKTITVFSYYRWFQCGCTDELSAASPSAEYTLSASEPYEVTIETGGDDKASTQGSITGGTSAHVRIRATSVGKIKAIRLTNTAADDPWFCDTLKLKRQDGSAVSFRVRRWIGTPYPTTAEVGLGEESGSCHISCRTRLIGATGSTTPEGPNMIKVLCPSNYQADEAQFVSSSICGATLIVTEVSSLGTLGEFTEASARKACRDMGCHDVEGEYYCAVAMGGIHCKGDEESFLKCTFDVKCTFGANHILDVAVMCTNNPPAKTPAKGTLRILSAAGAHANEGRLEVYLPSRDLSKWWSTVCDDNWMAASERIACLQMGYAGAARGGAHKESCTDYKGVNVCGPAGTRIICLMDFMCDGSESQLLQCPYTTGSDIYCSHDEDVVVSCEGDNGDPSGSGLHQKDPPPTFVHYSFPPKTKLTCSDTIASKLGGGGLVGTTVVATCEGSCSDAGVQVVGTLIYSEASPVCKAAVHAGVIGDGGGDVTLTLKHPIHHYTGTKRGEITSVSADIDGSKSFVVSRPTPNVLARLAETKQPHYAGVGVPPPTTSTATTATSFMEVSATSAAAPTALPHPRYAPVGWHGFNGDNWIAASDLPDADKVRGLTSFSVACRVRVMGEHTHRISNGFSQCNGFSLSVGDNDELVFDQICSPSPGVTSGSRVTYFQPEKYVAMYVNGLATDFEFELTTRLAIGRLSGDITAVHIYDYVLSQDDVNKDMDMSFEHPFGGVGTSRRHTTDGRLCTSPCKTSPPPPATCNVTTDSLGGGRVSMRRPHPRYGKLTTRVLFGIREKSVSASPAGRHFPASIVQDLNDVREYEHNSGGQGMDDSDVSPKFGPSLGFGKSTGVIPSVGAIVPAWFNEMVVRPIQTQLWLPRVTRTPTDTTTTATATATTATAPATTPATATNRNQRRRGRRGRRGGGAVGQVRRFVDRTIVNPGETEEQRVARHIRQTALRAYREITATPGFRFTTITAEALGWELHDATRARAPAGARRMAVAFQITPRAAGYFEVMENRDLTEQELDAINRFLQQLVAAADA
ncbi:unnamed protein product [Vitrella brassicaformis CCMP3155]|uniref:SRCR domain-containing protein n=1 Tax=Vitrella brassicaformis (strain CCMP3155) TaxID=1169540 RepID=A0A0G4GYL3_VITBC|nr:unnamed protein product [Vitrella brassicaformis CCMP3155]|eukprot:CEM36225.1 unnamed protein product [Vitrella brassicaformis CCMP3155]